MKSLQIQGTEKLDDHTIIVQLSDGRALTFSLTKLLTLVPDSLTTEADATALEGNS